MPAGCAKANFGFDIGFNRGEKLLFHVKRSRYFEVQDDAMSLARSGPPANTCSIRYLDDRAVAVKFSTVSSDNYTFYVSLLDCVARKPYVL